MTQYINLLAYPAGHSISPVFQQAALDHHGLDARYDAVSTAPDALGDAVDTLRGDGYLGANVTIPHKEAVRRHLDALDPWAETLGAVNTIVKQGSRLVGHNTDSYGLLRALREQAGFQPRGRSVLLLGAGGAARAAAFGLCREGLSMLTIANRTIGRAEDLVVALSREGTALSAISLEQGDIAGAVAGADLIVNATSVGMSHGGAAGESPIDVGLIRPGTVVFDMVYTPLESPLVVGARSAGAVGVSGLWMLIYQGAAAFELWTGREAPAEVMYEAGRTALLAAARPS
jgi:shikimate dehydrogenase